MSGNSSGIKRERISLLHKKLHSNEIKQEKLDATLETSITNNNSNRPGKIRRNSVRRYLGEPLPLPYLIKPQPSSPTETTIVASNNTKTPINKPIKFENETNIRLKHSLKKLQQKSNKQSPIQNTPHVIASPRRIMIDQSVQTEDILYVEPPKTPPEVHISSTKKNKEKIIKKKKIKEVKVINIKDILSSPFVTLVLLITVYYMFY